MTKSQIWVFAFLVVFVLLFILGKLTNNSNIQSQGPMTNTVPQSEMSSKELSASDLVARLGCVNCHGQDLGGTRLGPDLSHVKNYWSRDELINYLRNPSSFMDSERFQAYQAKYPGMMPPFNNVDVKDLGKIADYLLK